MTSQLAYEIQLEQNHGRSKYGKGEDDCEHDDMHDESDWLNFMHSKLREAEFCTPQDYRHKMIQVAGFAVSAIESMERKAAK